jgi:hypothetical protein
MFHNLLIPVSSISAEVSSLKEHVKTKSQSISELVSKIQNINTSIRKVFRFLITMNVVQCFENEINSWKKLQNVIPDQFSYFRIEEGSTSNTNNVISLLILAYFANSWQKFQNPNSPYRSGQRQLPGVPTLDQATKSVTYSANVLGDQTAKAFDALRKNFTQAIPGQTQSGITSALNGQILQNAQTYILLVKDAIARDMGEPFKSQNDDNDGVTKALKLYTTCAMIITDNVSRKAAGEEAAKRNMKWSISTATDIPEGAIKILEDLKFVKTYSQWYSFGLGISDDKKKEKTKGGLLRWYKGLKGSSRSEKTMVFLFSLLVINIVDPIQVGIGYQDWKETEKFLHKVIELINKHEMDLYKAA